MSANQIYIFHPYLSDGRQLQGSFHVKRDGEINHDKYIEVTINNCTIYINNNLMSGNKFTDDVKNYYKKSISHWNDKKLINIINKLIKNGIVYSEDHSINFTCGCQQTDQTIWICDYHNSHTGVPVHPGGFKTE